MTRKQIFASFLLGGLTCGAQTGQAPAAHPTLGAHPNPADGKFIVSLSPREEVPSLDQAIRMSMLIVDGTVAEVLPSINRNSKPPAAIETHSTVAVTEILLGKLPAGTANIVLVQEGGKVGSTEEVVPEDPLVRAGERYILFLDADDRKGAAASPSSAPRYYAVGIWGGRANVEAGVVQFLPRALPGLHEHDGAVASAFLQAVRERIGVLIPKNQIVVSPRQ
jgi:hypothetical protein